MDQPFIILSLHCTAYNKDETTSQVIIMQLNRMHLGFFSFLNKHFLVKIKQSLKILNLNDYVC